MTTSTQRPIFDYIPRVQHTVGCADAACKTIGHRVPLEIENFLSDRNYLYVRNSLRTDKPLHSRIQWNRKDSSLPKEFRRDVIDRIQDVHNAILRAINAQLKDSAQSEEWVAIDPTRVTILLVDNNTTKIIQDDRELDGADFKLLPEDVSIWPSDKNNTIHGAMLYLRDQVLNKPSDDQHADRLSPGPLSAVSSVSRHARPVESRKRDIGMEKHGRSGKRKQRTPPGTPAGGTTGQGVPLTPDAHPQKPNDEKKTTVEDNSTVTPPTSPRSADDDASVTSGSNASDKDGAEDLLRGTPPGTPRPRVGEPAVVASRVITSSSLLERQRTMAAAMDQAPFLEGVAKERISFEDFRKGTDPKMQSAFMKLVDTPDCDDEDAVIARKLLYAWFTAGYNAYKATIPTKFVDLDYSFYSANCQNPHSKEIYMQKNAFIEWFDRLNFESHNKIHLRNSILKNFNIPT